MADIEFAFWPRRVEGEQAITGLIQKYQDQNKGVHVRAYSLDSVDPWKDVSRVMIQKSGTDVTEVGASWIDSLVATNSLRPFSQREFESMGGASAFVIPAGIIETVGNKGVVYSIPYRADARLVFYRRDLLARAGVDEATAFTTAQNVLQTLELLKRSGVDCPLVAPVTTGHLLNLSYVASWVWSAGGDFINSAGSRVIFDQPAAISGMADYFKAMAYIPPEYQHLGPAECEQQFQEGKAAVALSGPWLYYRLQEMPEYAQVKGNLGVALPPLQACCGGTHLVIWRHTMHDEAAVDFVRFLTSVEVQAGLSEVLFHLPARLEASKTTRYAVDPNYQMIVNAVHTGRSYNASPLWNIVEDRLSHLLVQLAQTFYQTPPPDVYTFLAGNLEALARRINITLQG